MICVIMHSLGFDTDLQVANFLHAYSKLQEVTKYESHFVQQTDQIISYFVWPTDTITHARNKMKINAR